jgi:hypothetical protein
MEHFYNQGRREMSKKVVQTAGREQLGGVQTGKKSLEG